MSKYVIEQEYLCLTPNLTGSFFRYGQLRRSLGVWLAFGLLAVPTRVLPPSPSPQAPSSSFPARSRDLFPTALVESVQLFGWPLA